jgi:23S rRNA (adenine-N6)-dimethyltransferase
VTERRRVLAPRSALGQHFVRSDGIAADLVRSVGIAPDDLVVEIGAGGGRLTHALSHRARRVIAIEIDDPLVRRLRRVFAGVENVEIVGADALSVPLPDEPFRVFGNVPFAITTAILRHLLDDPCTGLRRADLIVQEAVAVKRSRKHPSNARSVAWSPWWDVRLVDRLPRDTFQPPPAANAAMLSMTRRSAPWLPSEERAAFVALVEAAFAHGGRSLRRSLGPVVGPRALRDAARSAGVDVDALPSHISAAGWCRLFLASRSN